MEDAPFIKKNSFMSVRFMHIHINISAAKTRAFSKYKRTMNVIRSVISPLTSKLRTSFNINIVSLNQIVANSLHPFE